MNLWATSAPDKRFLCESLLIASIGGVPTDKPGNPLPTQPPSFLGWTIPTRDAANLPARRGAPPAQAQTLLPHSQPHPAGCSTRREPSASGRSIPLAVLPSSARAPGFGRTRTGRRRAIVLLLIHLVFLAHLTHYFVKGRTLSPVEPSESMYTLEQGLVNAGFIFFSLALLSTLIFGRFFCGWGCHVVALQDLCAWLLSKINIRPRPFRSRLLLFIPLFFALYMFVWPTFKRELLLPFLEKNSREALAYFRPVAPFPGFTNHLVTDNFWATFAGPLMAIPFLFICGFACVYFLGAKGFCSYGCPYGGFFYHLDKLSPGRIVVDHDKCEGCGHCTATCTSNVRVHEEIRDYGMVVSAGCMKCMDCIAVCPNDALAFTFAAPSIFKSETRGRRTSKPGVAKRQRAKKQYDLSWPEEVALALLFIGSFVALRGLYGAVPMLMAVGASGCIAFIAWKLWRLLRDPNVTLHNFSLRLKGRVRVAGIAFGAFGALTLAFAAHSATIKVLQRRADPWDRRVTVPLDAVLADNTPAIPADQLDAARRAIHLYTLASPLSIGGLGLASTPEIDIRLAWLHAVVGDFARAESALRRVDDRRMLTESLAQNLARFIAIQKRPGDADAFLLDIVRRYPRFDSLRAQFAGGLAQRGDALRAEQMLRDGAARAKGRAAPHIHLAQFLGAQGRTDDSISSFRRAIAVDPRSAPAHYELGMTLLRADTKAAPTAEQALASLTRAHELSPRDPLPVMGLAQAYLKLGRADDARRSIELAEQLQRESSAARDAAPSPH